VRAALGLLLGFAVLLVGMLLPILMTAGISGMIWGCRVFSGPQAKDDPATVFAISMIVFAIPVGAYFTLCVFVLPILARFDVNVLGKRETSNMVTGLARGMKSLALRYASSMDKLINQEKV
jgi:hypothetical protein